MLGCSRCKEGPHTDDCIDTFSSDFFGDSSTPLDNHGQSLLSDMEGQSLADFFSNTDPFNLTDSQPFGPPADTKLAGNDFHDWNFMAPPTVHQVSATIPDQAQLHHGFHSDSMFATHPLQLDHMATTHDDLQAASTLFNNSQQQQHQHQHQQPPYAANRSHSYHDISSSSNNTHAHPNHHSIPNQAHGGTPMVVTSQGLLHEQLAALLPNHGAAGTLDAQLAAHWAGSEAQMRAEGEAALRRPSLKRTYTFGTDDSFNNPAGFNAPHNETEEQVTRRLMRDMRQSQTFIPDNISYLASRSAAAARISSNSDSSAEEEDETSSASDSHQPTKKRKKSTPHTSIKKEPLRKTGPGSRISKPKKPTSSSTTTADSDANHANSSKKKRPSSTATTAAAAAAATSTSTPAKLARENLSEQQKRNNHILSEQKRRNLIKRGFDDLHDLVPEIRNGGLSKSSVLMEAANFLEKLIKGNGELGGLCAGV